MALHFGIKKSAGEKAPGRRDMEGVKRGLLSGRRRAREEREAAAMQARRWAGARNARVWASEQIQNHGVALGIGALAGGLVTAAIHPGRKGSGEPAPSEEGASEEGASEQGASEEGASAE